MTEEFKDWLGFKLEETTLEGLCLFCKKETKSMVTALHIIHKKMNMGYCCSEDCFTKYKVKYNLTDKKVKIIKE